MNGQLLLWIGVGLMAVAAVGALLAAICFRIRSRRLNRQLEREYGPRER